MHDLHLPATAEQHLIKFLEQPFVGIRSARKGQLVLVGMEKRILIDRVGEVPSASYEASTFSIDPCLMIGLIIGHERLDECLGNDLCAAR